jgi:hypothetical protein
MQNLREVAERRREELEKCRHEMEQKRKAFEESQQRWHATQQKLKRKDGIDEIKEAICKSASNLCDDCWTAMQLDIYLNTGIFLKGKSLHNRLEYLR